VLLFYRGRGCLSLYSPFLPLTVVRRPAGGPYVGYLSQDAVPGRCVICGMCIKPGEGLLSLQSNPS
jgi:hypothetical protein